MTKIIVKTDKQDKYVSSYFLSEAILLEHLDKTIGNRWYIVTDLTDTIKGSKLIETPDYLYYIKH